MTDEQIAAAYLKASGIDISRVPNGIAMARAFIEVVFDALPVAGYLNPDGGFAQEEWEAGADCVEIFRRPE